MVLAKLEIKSFSDNLFTPNDEKKDFIVPINPEGFTKNFKIEHDTTRGHGNSQTNPKFKSPVPEELKIDFILDGTNTMEGYHESLKNLKVTEQLAKLLECVYDYDGKIHRPRFLQVMYGSELNFPSVLSTLDINHTLFDQEGSPLRVKISATFLKYVAPEKRAKEERNQSPDLTHERVFRQDDRLDLLSFEFYGTPAYILQLGKVNNLTTIRNIPAGTSMIYPPLAKTDNNGRSKPA